MRVADQAPDASTQKAPPSPTATHRPTTGHETSSGSLSATPSFLVVHAPPLSTAANGTYVGLLPTTAQKVELGHDSPVHSATPAGIAMVCSTAAPSKVSSEA